jgi:hypothetical protein
VQAKTLRSVSNCYSSIAYPKGSGLQIKKLIGDAKRKNCLPLYAFYSKEAPATMPCAKHIGNEGVFVASATRIMHEFIAPGRKRVLRADLLRTSMAMSCFLCCPHLHGRPDGYEWFSRHCLASGGPATDHADSDHAASGGAVLGFHQAIPREITSFLQYDKKGVPNWWEREFAHFFEGANALLVYDARPKD